MRMSVRNFRLTSGNLRNVQKTPGRLHWINQSGFLVQLEKVKQEKIRIFQRSGGGLPEEEGRTLEKLEQEKLRALAAKLAGDVAVLKIDAVIEVEW